MVLPRCDVSSEHKVSKPHSGTAQNSQIPTLISTQPFLLLPHPHIPISSGAEVTLKNEFTICHARSLQADHVNQHHP